MKKLGFTLIELLVVILIVSILAAVAVPRYSRSMGRAKWSEANASAGSIRIAVRAYTSDAGVIEAQALVGTRLDNTDTQQTLGFGPADLDATYFSPGDYTITAIDSTGTAEIVVTGGSKLASPRGSYKLELDGDWVIQ